jgi:hypothetical protein
VSEPVPHRLTPTQHRVLAQMASGLLLRERVGVFTLHEHETARGRVVNHRTGTALWSAGYIVQDRMSFPDIEYVLTPKGREAA